ncbi:MAG: hypothetical protein UHY90_01480 [Treponema sp.]|nr:hypothetical protein [Treponema sp.]
MLNIPFSTRITIICVFAAYTILLLVYGIISKYGKNSKLDFLSKFYTGGRVSGKFMTAMMVSAGVAGAGVFMGVPGFTYRFGAIWMVCCFFSMTSNFMVLGLIGKRIGIIARRINATTFIELFSNRYNNSKTFSLITSLVILFFLGAFGVSTLTGGGRIFQVLTGQDYRIGLAIFTVLVIIAALLGGIKGIATAMIIQGIVMTASVILLFVMGVNSTGLSYTQTIGEVLNKYPQWFSPAKGLMSGDEKFIPVLLKSMGTVFSFAILWGLTTFTMPHVSMSALTYKDTKTLHDSIKIGTIVFAIWMLGLNGLCFVVKYHFGGMLGGQGQPSVDLGIPMLAIKAMPAWAAGLFLAGVCSAVQSSVGSMIIALSGTIVKDIYMNIFNAKPQENKLKAINAVFTIIVALVIFAFACKPPAMLASLITYATGGMTVAFFAPMLFGLYWKRANEYSAVSSILCGIILYIGIDILNKKGILQNSLGLNPCVVATLLSTVIMIAVSLTTPKSPYRVINTWFGKQ